MIKDMWELAKTTSHGGNSVRRIFTFVLTVILAVLLLVAFTSPATHAATDQIHFIGNNLSYQGNQYSDAGKAQAGNSAGIPVSSEYYTFTVPVTTGVPTQQTDIIYFAAGKTPTNETSATFAVYDTDASRAPPTYSNPSAPQTVTVQNGNQGTDGGNSCAIQGIGWIACPVSNALAGGMDWLMGVLGGFVKVQPLAVGDTHNDLYVAWNLMRNIANVAFIIVFIIIIYSQLTNFGVSNYGLKKLLPRLIVGAVIVNLSYFICAAILDVSNILGSSIQDLLISMRTTVFNAGGSNASISNSDFSSLTTMALAGGSVAAGTVVAGVALNTTLIGGTLAGLWYLLLPALLALFLAVMVVVLILAARQALIIILIVLSPLAFVAYLLPNTEKWFKKWRDTFTTMMVFYPAFSVVFAGSQLASAVIIKNAQSMTVVVLGLIVQVAPLAITPWLLRLSGSTIQSVAKIAQGLNKRVNGAANSWASPRREAARLRGLSTPSANPFRRNAQFWYSRGQNVKNKTDAYGIGAQNMHQRSRRYEKTDLLQRGFEADKQIIEKAHGTHWSEYQASDPTAARREIQLRSLGDRESAAKIVLDNRFDELRAQGASSAHARLVGSAALAEQIRSTHATIGALGAGSQSAKNMQQKYLAEALNAAESLDPNAPGNLLTMAAGIDPNGRTRAQASATTALAKIESEAVENTTKLLGARAAVSNMTVKEYTTRIAKSVKNGTTVQDGFNDPTVIEAAIEAIAQDGDISTLEALRMDKDRKGIDQTMLSRVFARNAGTLKQKGGFHLQQSTSLANATEEEMNLARGFTLSNITTEHIKDAKAGWLADTARNIGPIIASLENAMANPKGATQEDRNEYADNARAALEQIYLANNLALTDTSYLGSATDRYGAVKKIEAALAIQQGEQPYQRKAGDPPDDVPVVDPDTEI